VTFIFDYSSKVLVYILKRKVDMFDVFKKFIVLVENRMCMLITCLRINKKGEFTYL
jgi:hypothetical protein